ncbi:MAG: hypothetical protein NTX97_12570, partial [Bacteroidetes bacterium]|nr:hypothetical protein [Bacteroidota bacterium]
MKKEILSISFLVSLLISPFIGTSATYYSRLTGNWTSPTTWSTSACGGAAASTIPGLSDNVVICAGKTVTMNGAPGACLSLTISGTANWTSATAITNVGVGGLTLNNGSALTGSAIGTINVSGPMNVVSGASVTLGGINLTVTGTSTLDGTLSANNLGGAKAFTNFVINSAGSFTSTVAETYSISGNLTMNGGSLTGTSTGIFNVAGDYIISAGTNATIGNIQLTITGLTSINGTLTDNSTGGSNTFGNVNLNSTGKINNTSAETYTITGNLNTYGGDFLAVGATPIFNIAGNFNVVSGICDISRIKLTISGITTISGTLDINSIRGTKTFNDIVVTSTGVFNSVAKEDYVVNGNIQVNGTFFANVGIFTLAGLGKTITGATALIFDDIVCNGQYTNFASTKLTTRLKGSGTWTQGSTGVLDLGITDANFTVTSFKAATSGNTVIYSLSAGGTGGAQTIKTPTDLTYSNLTTSGNGIKTLFASTTLNSSLLISASTTLATGNKNLLVGGNFTNNGTFTAGSAIVSLNGTLAQVLGGTTITAFNNLTVSNASAIVSAATNFSVASSLNIGAGAILSPNATIIVSGPGTLTGNGTARVTRIATTPDFLSQYTISGKTLSGLNVDFIGAGNQSVNTLNYGSLTVSTNGSRTVIFPSSIVGVSNIFSPSLIATTYVVSGNTINMNGTVSQIIPAFNYNNLTSSSTGARTLSSSGTIGVAGVFTPFTNTYTIAGSTIDFNGTVPQSVPAFNYYNLTSSSAGSRTLPATGTVGVASTFIPGTNSFINTGSTINFNGTISQNLPAFTYNNMITSGSGSKILTGNIIVQTNLTIASNLDVSASNYSITIKKDWVNNGTFSAQNGAVLFNGAAAQTLSGTGSTTFNQVDINNTSGGVKLTSGTYILNSVINPLSGNFNTNGQNFTMLSSSSKTARIGQVAATASLSGNFIIQRYLSSRNATYADLSSTVQSSTINDWDAELPAISYTHAPPSSLASAYTYDETGDAYVAITSATTPLLPGKGYEVFLAGDYSYASLPNTTMDAIGVPNQGNKNLSSLISNNVQGWNLVGNPFASNVSWASIYAASGSAASGLYDYIEMYDYTIADWHGYTSASAIEIGSAQGFWVYGLPGATSLTLIIPESSKTTTSNSTIKTASLLEDYFTLKMSNEEGNLAHTFKIAANSNS